MKRNRFLALILSAVTVLALMIPASAAVTPAPEVQAVSTIVTDAYTGQVLYENNADEKRAIASVTKIMTGYLACEGLSVDDDKLDEKFTVSQHAADSDADGTSMYFNAGDEVSYEVLLYGTMLRSGNDAAVALAEACSDGDESAFLERMNAKAEELGMTSTHFSCVNGLIDEDNYSTARDLAILGRVVMQNELFAKVVGTWYIELDGYQIENHNFLLSDEYMGRKECLGIKTGFTTAAGRTLVSCAQRNGAKFIVVTLGEATNQDFKDHMALYDWAFANFPANVLCEKGKAVTTFRVGNQSVPLVAAETLVSSAAQSDTSRITCVLELPSQVKGAISKGAVAGKAVYSVNGEVIGETELLYDAILVN